MRILVVEDDKKIASFVVKGLKEAGFAVDCADNGEDALHLALSEPYDAAVIERRADGKVKITKKHETPTRAGGVLGAGVGLATGLVVVLFPFAAIGGGLVALTTAGGAVIGAVAGHEVLVDVVRHQLCPRAHQVARNLGDDRDMEAAVRQ